mgnify:CR=1 FL=1
MRLKEVALSNASPEAKIAGLAVLLDKELLRLSEVVLNTKKLQGPQGEQGLQGPKGEQGDRGFDGTNGKDGSDGKDGKDGHEGKDGVGVQDAKIDFDGSLVITLTNGKEINAGDVVPEGVADKIKVIKSGGGNSQTVLDAIEDIQTTIATYGTIATQDANAVAITGGAIDGTTVGVTTPAAGTFTTLTASALTATGQTNLGTSSAQYIRAVGDATAPVLSAQGSGTNIDLNLTTKGSGSFKINNAGGTVAEFNDGGAATPVNAFLFAAGAASGTRALIRATGGPITLLSTGTNSVNFATNGSSGNIQAAVSHTASAVNYVQVTGAATGANPKISAQGSDSTVGFDFQTKGAKAYNFFTNTSNLQLEIPHVASVNWLQVKGSATGNGVQFSAAGSDTNISQVFQSKGTGAIDLAAGSRGVNISNGGTVTAITRTATGSAYTGFPTVAITAPTTAGGVQATATAQLVGNSATVAGGGTGYTVNDVLTVTTGGGSGPINLTVTAVSGGVITAVTSTSGALTSIPANPVAVSGGTGSGATFNIVYVVAATFTITNAGSGYVEQPTVSFSGGGGSGAAAYATVGSGITIRSIGAAGLGSIDFSTPASATNGVPALRIRDVLSSTPSNTGYFLLHNNNGYAQLTAQGPTDAQMAIGASGAGYIRFNTNGTGETNQMRITHTASAVNYVQVTGAATGGAVAISAQGSDSNVGLSIKPKGTSPLYLETAGATDVRIQPNSIRSLSVSSVSSAVNYGVWTNATAGNAPSLAVGGTDTNIDLTLTPKGTGVVRTSGTGIRLYGSTSGYVGLKGAAAAGSTTYTLPAADGTTGQVLSTNGSATLSWATAASGNTTSLGMWENNTTISSNYSVTSGNNAMSAGPITVASGVVVTVPSGSVWTIV